MASSGKLLWVVAILAVTVAVNANDPDPLQDFCVADESNKIFINGFPCKHPAKVVNEDFTYRGLRNQGNLSFSFGAPLQKAFVQQFPGINTQGIAWARLDFAPAGLNVPHWHQRATEILSCQQGELLVGFVDTNNRLWSSVLKPGDITVFPRGLMHFQLNVGKGVASAVLALNSQNPGRSDVGASTFASGVKEQILEKAFGLSPEIVKQLEKFFSQPHVSTDGHETM
jgi:oxalate decarboxylase/phosphoglucose isomerase-like protein (cupin superfamily)